MKKTPRLKIPPDEEFKISDDPEFFIKEILNSNKHPKYFGYQDHLTQFLN